MSLLEGHQMGPYTGGKNDGCRIGPKLSILEGNPISKTRSATYERGKPHKFEKEGGGKIATQVFGSQRKVHRRAVLPEKDLETGTQKHRADYGC